MLTALGQAQIPLLAAMLLGGCAAKFARGIRRRSIDAGLGPTALFPLRLRPLGGMHAHARSSLAWASG